jgi:hypothetical protein
MRGSSSSIPNHLKYVHIIDTSVSKLSMAEGLVLIHLCGGMNGDGIALYGHRNVVMCRIADRPSGLVR